MSAFKPKSFKQITISQKAATTLDGKHTEIVNKFKNDEEVIIPNYKNEIENLEKRLNDKSLNLNLSQTREINDRIKKLKLKIKKLEKAKKDYYLKNSDLIFSYFEQKKGLEEGQSKTRHLHEFLIESVIAMLILRYMFRMSLVSLQISIGISS